MTAAPGECDVGRMLVVFAHAITVPEEKLGVPAEEAQVSAKKVFQLLDDLEKALDMIEGVSAQSGSERKQSVDALFYTAFGVSPSQIRYVLSAHSLHDNALPIAAMPDFLDQRRSWPRETSLVFDIGMSGGMDTHFFLTHGFRVVAVEANPLIMQEAASALSRFDDQLVMLNLAIVDPGEDGPVAFHIHKERPDFSATGDERVPMESRGETVMVQAATCADLMAKYGIPLAIKIDAEGADVACLQSLRSSGLAPFYVST
eukprot:3780375-Amphidinium_carterae.1